jgi:hypothetical protein
MREQFRLRNSATNFLPFHLRTLTSKSDASSWNPHLAAIWHPHLRIEGEKEIAALTQLP